MTEFAATQYTQKKALDHLLGISAWTMPTVYLGLSTLDPGEGGSLSGEPTSGAYARQEVTSKMNATVLATGIATLASLVQFPTLTLDQGTATHAILTDSATAGAGNVLFYAELDASQPLLAGAFPVEFVPDGLSVALENGNLTNSARKAILDHALGKTSFALPTVHLSLFTASPGNSGALLNEVTGSGYARVALSGSLGSTVLATGISTSTADVTFATPTGDWGLISYIGVYDSVSGTVLFYTPLRRAFTASSGSDAPVFKTGRLGFRMM